MFDIIYRVALGPAVILALILTGGYFCVRLRLFWVWHPRKALGAMRGDRGGGSVLSAVCMALAGTLGVGNIAGVALALLLGGAGSVFWMLLTAFFAMAVKYAEVLLAMDSRRGNIGNRIGGAMFYMRGNGIIGRCLPCLFSLLFCICAVLQGSVIQANAVGESLTLAIGVKPVFTGITLTVLAAVILAFGRRGIARVTAYAIPTACCVYMAMCVLVILRHVSCIPAALATVTHDILTPTAGIGGIAGYLFSAAARQGCAKGLLSNEAGCGTAPTAHVTAEGTTPVGQALFGIFEVFLDTAVICTLTALACLCVMPSGSPDAPIAYMISVFSSVFGNAAKPLTAFSITVFAFSTTLTWAFYGMSSLDILTKRPAVRWGYLALYCGGLLSGCLASPALVFTLTDILLALMTLINLPVLIKKADRVVTLSAEEGMIKLNRRHEYGTAQRHPHLQGEQGSPHTRAR